MGKYFLYCKKADFSAIASKFNISPMTARILTNRDVSSFEAISNFLYGSLNDCHDPFLMKGMKEAVEIIYDAISSKKKIRVIGDYDVDGVCSSYIIKHAIENLGGIVDVRLPDRILEGYGMNCQMIYEAKEDAIELIITCDNGVSAHDAVDLANELGIEVLVTDHHEVPMPLVKAKVVIDPKQEGCQYPFKELCGGGVAYKLAQALFASKNDEKLDQVLEDIIQFAGMATVADIVPLTGENRILAKEGIKRLQNTENKGIKAIASVRNASLDELNEYYIGFIIGPCINSAGRLRNAKIAYDLLEETDEEKAKEAALNLSELNEERKKLTLTQIQEAEKIIREKYAPNQMPKVLVLYLPDAHESVAGIIAGRLKETYYRPVLVITNSEDGFKGSGRSVEAYNMIEELQKHEYLFEKYGGHKKAAGFSLKDGVTPEELSDVLNNDCLISEENLEEKTWIDMQLPFKYITEGFVEELKLLEPFGLKNEKPLFAQKNIKVNSVCVMGRNQNVLRMTLEDEEGYEINAIKFGSEEIIAKEAEEIKEKMLSNTRISFLFSPEINEFRNRKNPQVKIREFI